MPVITDEELQRWDVLAASFPLSHTDTLEMLARLRKYRQVEEFWTRKHKEAR